MNVFQKKKQVECIIIPYIALGFVLSLAIGIEYNCAGQEMFPVYYGSPFVFKQLSLGSSLEYYYSISGLLLNVATWSLLLILFRLLFRKLKVKFGNKKIITIIYKRITVILIIFTTLNIIVDLCTIGRGFDKGFNYWYINLNSEAKNWGVNCKGELIVFKK